MTFSHTFDRFGLQLRNTYANEEINRKTLRPV
jgi:hypothetical protein